MLLQKGRPSRQFQEIMDAAHAAGVRGQWRDERWFQTLGPAGGQGVAARLAETNYLDDASLFQLALEAPLPVVLALDQVQDTQNVGTIVRSAWAMGAGGVLLPKHNAAHLGGGAARAAAGTLHRLPIARAMNLGRSLAVAAEAGWHCYALAREAPGETPALDLLTAPLQFPACFVLGNEDKGVRPGVAKECEARLWIPQRRDFDSLNVAQSAAMVLAVASQRNPMRDQGA